MCRLLLCIVGRDGVGLTETKHIWSTGLLQRMLRASPLALLAAAFGLLVLVTLADRFSGSDLSLGVLYVIPIVPAGVVLGRGWLIAFAILAATVRILVGTFDSVLEAGLRFGLSVLANSGVGLFISELVRNRKLVMEHMDALEQQQALRKELEEHLHALADGSPAAIFTLDEKGRILTGNRATRQLLGVTSDEGLRNTPIQPHLPVLVDALLLDTGADFLRTGVQCQGRRVDGSLFSAHIWMSTYATPQGRRLAAIAVDTSDEVREREEQNLRQILDNNRVIAGAVAHEIRNVCGAISLVYANLRRSAEEPDSEDFRALGHLVQALEKISATDLQGRVAGGAGTIELKEILDHLRIVIEPAWTEVGGEVLWDVPADVPAVQAEGFGLTQAFLNLAQNSLRAVAERERRSLTISVRTEEGRVRIAFEDSGPGIRDDQRLFEPFQPGAEHVGLGLYVSRAILRSFGGELRHEPALRGCRFVAELAMAPARSVQAA